MLNSSKKLRYIHRENGYDVFDDELLTLPDKVHAIIYDGFVYVLRPKALERIFDIKQPYLEEVDEVFNALEGRNISLRDESLREAFKRDLRCLRRVHEMKKYDLHNKIEASKLEDIANRYDSPVDITRDSGSISLDVEDLRSKFKVLDLLGDNYLRSELTEYQYTADGKEML